MKFLVALFFAVTTGLFFGRFLADETVSRPEKVIPTGQQKKVAGTPGFISSDTLTSFVESSERPTFDRLALWLLDADSAEISHLWTHYSALPDFDGRTARVILNAWARHDPASVMAATRGHRFEDSAWMAIASYHPDLAYQENLALYQKTGHEDLLRTVLSIVGSLHPSWVRANYEGLSEDWMKEEILLNYRADLETTSARESVEFLLEHGEQIETSLLIALGKEDPVEALRLAGEARHGFNFPGNKTELLIESLATEDPSLLDSLAAHTRSPVTRNLIEFHQFQRELQEDPEGALERVKGEPMSFGKQDKMAALSRHFLESDPQRALDLFAQLIAESPGGLTHWKTIITENSERSWQGKNSPSTLLLQELIASQPGELVQATLTQNDGGRTNYQGIIRRWAEHDSAGLAEWTENQSDPEVHLNSSKTLSNHYLNSKQFTEAMNVAEKLRNRSDKGSAQMAYVYRHWHSRDPDGATTWRASANLTTQENSRLNEIEQKEE